MRLKHVEIKARTSIIFRRYFHCVKNHRALRFLNLTPNSVHRINLVTCILFKHTSSLSRLMRLSRWTKKYIENQEIQVSHCNTSLIHFILNVFVILPKK